MPAQSGTIRPQVEFLRQEPDTLRALRGRELYDTLSELGLTHTQYFRALDTNVTEYCAQEFGVDLSRITVDRFFQSDPNAKWLFPDIVRDAVVAGLTRKPVYPDLIIRDEPVEGTAYDVPFVEESEDDEELRGVAEGAAIPESAINHGSRIVRLDKKGRGVLASYEAIRRMSVDMVRVHLQRIGERLGRQLDKRLATVLIDGDGSSANTAAPVINTEQAGAWSYDDIVNGFMTLTLDHYFNPTHMLANGELCRELLGLAEFKEPNLFDFAKTGNLPTPLGMRLAPMADQPDDKLTILDAGYAVEKLTEQDLLVENDKLINQQWERTYLTVVTDFAVIYEKARVVINSDWE